MNLLLILTALLFYTKATETKECPSYVVTEKEDKMPNLKAACEALNGKMASEDLKDSENAEAVKQAVDEFYKKKPGTDFFLGITVKDPDLSPNEDTNPFVFSDGTNFDFDDESYVYQFTSGEPTYNDVLKCTYMGSGGEIFEADCTMSMKALCFIDCLNSGSESSRKNFPLFALFVAGSVFSAFFDALAGLDF